jgi:hypothetical protein
MLIPYFRTMYILSLMKGPNIDDWAHDQVVALRTKTTRANNPLDRTNEDLWNDFDTAFTNAFTDTAKEQTAHQKLMALKMYKEDVDTYISTFGHLVREANYDRDAKGTMHLFAQGLNPKILEAILYGNAIPTTIDGWETAAREEIKKNAFRQTMLHPQRSHFKWQFGQHNGNFRSRRHPNNEVVPKDVDQPVFTQINRAHTQINKAYTDDDKRKHRSEGRCFNCSRIGHMAKECPMRKTSATQFKPQYKPSYQSQSKQSNWRTTTRKYNQPKKRTFVKPIKFGHQAQSYARSANIEEVDEESNDEEDIPTVAARASKFDEGQREQWVQEMKNLGINF